MSAVIGDDYEGGIATHPMRSGDVAVVLRASGGIELCTLAPEDPDQADLGSLGMRGLYALALFKLAHDPGLMRDVIRIVHKETEQSSAPVVQ